MKQFNRYLISTVVLTVLMLWLSPGFTTEPLQGRFIAEKGCPALHSIKKQTNPGNVTLTPGVAYRITGQNKAAAFYYQINIEGIDIPQRWVAVSCGKLAAECRDCAPTAKPSAAVNKDYVLAVSWQAGFCESHRQKAECAGQTPERFDATHFSLHGLWPQPINNAYCGVSGNTIAIDRNKQWHLLPQPPISDEVTNDLAQAMPGTASNLQRHEWIKHGTCYGAGADEYFQDAISLLTQLNASSIREWFAGHVGKTLTSEEIRAKFDETFATGSGRKVSVQCSGNLITEIWLNLRGDIDANTKLTELLAHSPPARKTCERGKVDPAGF